MKPEKLHDAMNFIDDELIEAADKIRQAPKSSYIKSTRILALAAAVLVVFTGVLIFAHYISLDITSDDAANVKGNDLPKSTDELNSNTDIADKTDDSIDVNATDGNPSDMGTSTRFEPSAFAANIPTPPNECFAFYHKIFPTSVYLYFYTNAHYFTEENTPDKSSIKAYSYDTLNPDNGIGTVTFPLPEDFDLSYDSATPIYANGGGGSSECMVVFRFDYGTESVFVVFNNFAYTDDILAFEYAGQLEEEAVKTALVDAISKLNPPTYHEGGEK